MGDAKVVTKICESFLKNSVLTKGNLAKSLDSGNIVDLRRHAHSLKGACGYVCSERLKASALKLQLACEVINDGKSTDTSELQELLLLVYDELTKLSAAIKAHLDG